MSLNCDRCGDRYRSAIMSRFSREMICPPCQKDEQKLPRYERAKLAARHAVIHGPFPYPGFGLTTREVKILEEARRGRRNNR
jgi:hypothetical protein